MKIDFSIITADEWLRLDNHAISRRMRCSPATVARERKRLGHPTVRGTGSGRKPTFDIRRFRKDLSIAENARALGITYQRAWQVRKKLDSEDWE